VIRLAASALRTGVSTGHSLSAAPPRGVTCHQPPWERRASAAALLVLARWVTPDLPLYGYDHDRGDFAP